MSRKYHINFPNVQDCATWAVSQGWTSIALVRPSRKKNLKENNYEIINAARSRISERWPTE